MVYLRLSGTDACVGGVHHHAAVGQLELCAEDPPGLGVADAAPRGIGLILLLWIDAHLQNQRTEEARGAVCRLAVDVESARLDDGLLRAALVADDDPRGRREPLLVL